MLRRAGAKRVICGRFGENALVNGAVDSQRISAAKDKLRDRAELKDNLASDELPCIFDFKRFVVIVVLVAMCMCIRMQ